MDLFAVRLMAFLDAFLTFFCSGAEYPPASKYNHLNSVGSIVPARASRWGSYQDEQNSWWNLTTKDNELLIQGVENLPV